MRSKFLFSRMPVVIGIAVLLTSCLTTCSVRERMDGYVYYRLSFNPTTVDPALVVDVSGGLLSAKLFNGLVRLDRDLRVMPDIAERWERSSNGTSYTFYLRKAVRFSNGREVTASDVKYSFERILSPGSKSPNTWVLDKIRGAKSFMSGAVSKLSGISIQDDHTVTIELERPFAPFLYLLTMTAAYIVPEEEVRKMGADFSSHPVGTGPFVLREWQHGSRLVFARNNDYFGGSAHVKGIVYKIVPEDLTAVTEFELGNLDAIAIPANEYARYKTSPRWSRLIASVEGLNTYYLGFNCSRPPFDDKELRRAVASAIDRAKILRTFYEGRGRLAAGPVPDILRNWTAPSPVSYDPCKARRMAQKLTAQHTVIHFYITADQEVSDIAEIIQDYLRKAGFVVRIKQLEWSSYKAALNNGEADMFWISWWADYPDPENFLFPLFHSSNHGASGNRSRYTNHEVDGLIEAGQRALDPAEKFAYYGRAEQLIVQDSPWVFFWHKTDYTVRQPSLKSYEMKPIYTMDKGLDVSL
jgi:ABC-type transport system substrate-binding protein